MKNRVVIIFAITVIGLFAACNGDHATRSGIDTVKNQYGTDTARVNKSSIDSGKVTTKTGDASNLDNSASGGTKIARDTLKQKTNPKK